MTLQEARTKAAEGGYHHDSKHRERGMHAGVIGMHTFTTVYVEAIFLDPNFWCAFGRTLGWHHERVWTGYWQGFIDHVAQGKTPESFFTNL